MSVDIMVDLETLGLEAGCVILSIGATTFDLQHQFYTKISVDDSKSKGLTANSSTLSWWDKQNITVREEAFSGVVQLIPALGSFSDWYRSVPGTSRDKFIWGNGADFDIPILKAAYSIIGMKEPWEPFNGRCYRTLKNLYFEEKAEAFEGDKHNALSDAIHQAKHARSILKKHFLNKISKDLTT